MKFGTDRNHYLSSQQVAELIGVTKRTIFNWLKAGKIPAPERRANGYFQWTLEDVQLIRTLLEEMHR